MVGSTDHVFALMHLSGFRFGHAPSGGAGNVKTKIPAGKYARISPVDSSKQTLMG
jgi:TnpA family transposase